MQQQQSIHAKCVKFVSSDGCNDIGLLLSCRLILTAISPTASKRFQSGNSWRSLLKEASYKQKLFAVSHHFFLPLLSLLSWLESGWRRAMFPVRVASFSAEHS